MKNQTPRKQDKKQVIRLQSLEGWRPYKGYVLVKPKSKEGLTTEAGVIVGFNVDTNYGEGTESHVADLSPTEGEVLALPLIHYTGPDYYVPNEVEVGDHVWFSYRGSVQGIDVLVGKEQYLLVQYLHLLASRRGEETIILNGYVLLEEVEVETEPTVLEIAKKKDPNRGIVRYLGCRRNYYDSRFTDEIDLELGDIVLLRRGGHNIQMERQPWLASFDEGKMYRRVKRRDIMAVLNSFEFVE